MKFARYTGKVGFFRNWGLPFEHFEYPQHHTELNFTKGNKGEYLALALIFLIAMNAGKNRLTDEEGVRSNIIATNTYSVLHLDEKSA